MVVKSYVIVPLVYLVPMTISLGFGIVFATAIILVLMLVPCLYMILEDIHARRLSEF